jgi:hypothetical protein
MSAPDLTPQIQSNATSPQSMEQDGRTATSNPIGDVIEADRYLKGPAAAKRQGFGLRAQKIVPPGAG